MTCSERDSGIYAQCAEMYSDIGDTYGQAEPRWGWIMLAVCGLAILFILDMINDYRRHR